MPHDPVFYARRLAGELLPEPERRQELRDHLRGVADRARRFADAFCSSDWGLCAGLWHDLGKYQADFQRRLRGEPVAVEHSGVGAAFAFSKGKHDGLPLAFAIAGHHAGIANFTESGHALPTPLRERLKSNAPTLEEVSGSIPPDLSNLPLPTLPGFLRAEGSQDRTQLAALKRQHEFWIRFLFSALVDADRLDAEEFADPTRAATRAQFPGVGKLRERVDDYIDRKVESIPADVRGSLVNIARAEVLDACRTAAEMPPGFFTLTVPTGGGKTLSGMSFALRHAARHDLRRVIVVIPYTSIIEQNAGEYRQALGRENVVEHHCNLDSEKHRAEYGEQVAKRHDLASENWDAPVIVTTTVQFFESLFSNAASRCRKLHNVSHSVVILDEVQTLPPGFLLSIVDALKEIVAHYGCSVVLSTATPPALTARETFPHGLCNVRNIVADPTGMATALKRVEYAWPSPGDPPVDWPTLATRLAEHEQVLAVVHRREDSRLLAQELQTLVPVETVFHLSALMCPADRTDVLAEIRNALGAGAPCRVVSTQLVEAGVDVDFPVVYRALAGLDSIVQAGGRCNREARHAVGSVFVFRAATRPPPGTPRRAMEVTESMLGETGSELDPHDPSLFETYFRMLYLGEHQDVKQIQTQREHFNFATVGREFRLIEDGFSEPVVVPYGEGGIRIQRLRREGPSREALRGLQPFTVSIYPEAFQKLAGAGALFQVVDGIWGLAPGFEGLYKGEYGLVVGDEVNPDPSVLVA